MARRKQSLGFWIVLALLLLDAVAVVVFFAIGGGPNRRSFEVERLNAGTPAPDVYVVRADGTKLKLSSLKGRPVLLHFWASWCVPCRDELPSLLEAARGRAGQGGPNLVAVSLDAGWEQVRAFFDGPVPAEIFRDGDAAQAFRVEGLPATYLIAADGTIAGRMLGPRDWASKEARGELEKLATPASDELPAGTQ